MVRNASRQANALARARERRRELDRERDAQDQRIEEATARTLVALEELADAEAAQREATLAVAEALRTLLVEDVSVDRAAALLQLGVAEARRLAKVTAPEPPRNVPRTSARSTARADAGADVATPAAVMPSVHDSGPNVDAARRAG